MNSLKPWYLKPTGLLVVYGMVFAVIQVANSHHLVRLYVLQTAWMGLFVMLLLTMPDWSRPEPDADPWVRS